MLRSLRRSASGAGHKILASIAILGAAGSVAGLGTFAAFTSSTNASHRVSTGTVALALGAAGAATNRLGVDVPDIAPGQAFSRAFDLRNTGSSPFGSLTLTTTATTSSILDTDAADGLQVEIERCSTAWAESGVAPAFGYSCSGTRTTVIASRPVVGSGLALSGLNASSAGGQDHLLLVLELPLTAGNAFQSKSSTLSYEFTARQ